VANESLIMFGIWKAFCFSPFELEKDASNPASHLVAAATGRRCSHGIIHSSLDSTNRCGGT